MSCATKDEFEVFAGPKLLTCNLPSRVHRDGNPLLTDEGFLNPWRGIRGDAG